MLLEQHIRALRLKHRNHEVGTVVTIGQDQIPRSDAPQPFAKQSLFASTLT
jgi:hypothetical protein